MKTWKVGDLAKASGITVRTLHHYEEIGLLEPSTRTESGHRVYSETDIRKLQQILSLKQLGFPLEEIRRCLTERKWSALDIVRMHRERVSGERERLGELLERLTMLERTLSSDGNPSTQELIKTIEVMNMYDKYFTKEQQEDLKRRQDSLGEAKMREYQESWKTLMADVRAAMKGGVDPFSAEGQSLAARWNALVQAFTGGDAKMETQLGSMYRNEPALRERTGMDPEIGEYVARMMSFRAKSKAK